MFVVLSGYVYVFGSVIVFFVKCLLYFMGLYDILLNKDLCLCEVVGMFVPFCFFVSSGYANSGLLTASPFFVAPAFVGSFSCCLGGEVDVGVPVFENWLKLYIDASTIC